MIRVGIIGLGMMGGMHYANWGKIDDAEVVAVADVDPKRAAGDLSGGWANIEGGAESLDMDRITGTTDPLELIAMDNVDVVDVCVPTPFHAELAVAALKAQKHCVCEKPLARTAEQGRQIVEAAEQAAGILLPAMCIRFWPEWAWLKTTVTEGTYGKVKDASFRRVGELPPGWYGDGKMSGGAILDMHLHDTDFIKYVFGMPKAVSSFGYVGHTGCIDRVLTNYIYDDGPVIYAEGSWGMAAGFGFNMCYCVNFERATAEYLMAREGPLVVYKDGESETIKCEGADGYLAELEYMAACISTGAKPTIVTGAEALESMTIVEAEVKSVQTAQPVAL